MDRLRPFTAASFRTRRPGKLFEFGWLSLSATALLMGALLSWQTYVRSNAVLEVARPLIDRDLPTLRVISELKSAAFSSERVAYEFYDSRDRERFRTRSAELRRGIAPRLQRLRSTITDAEGRLQLEHLQQLRRDCDRLLFSLDGQLAAPQVDIAEVRETLGQISLNASQRSDRLDVLVNGVQAQAKDRGDATRARLHDIIVLVAVFSALLVFATAIISYFLATYLRDTRERQRLALFPERNPNPVISLDAEGALAYANPGAMAMATALGAASPAALLPDDLGARLEELRHGQRSSQHWEYWRGTRLIGISIHCLEDCDAFHVYLSDVTERKQAQAQLEYQAFHDVLTRLPNRRAFENRISEALADGQSGAVLLLAADRFQPVVDTLGHAFADRVVCAIAERLAPLAGGSPATCHIHRFNGDLFAALLPKVTGADVDTEFAARIADEIAAPFLIDGRELFFSFSIGIARFPQDGGNVGELLRHADTALQSVVRAGGRAALGYAEEMSARALERLETEHELRRAVERGELELHYQPQLEIASGRIIGVEALVRWRHPTKGLISPADFIPIAEESGAILDLGAWILVTACIQNRQWQQAGLPPLVVAVNISPRQFADPQLPKTVLHALNSSGLDAQWLELEITESAAMHDIDAVIATLHAFKSIGVSLSIDDFGTGYSSLSYLKRFPIDKLKVDQSFVRTMIEDPSDAAIAHSVIMLGHSLGLTVLAEGVETQAHLRLLGDYGCEQFQGYLFSRPKPAVEVCAMLEEQHARDSNSA